MKHDVSSGPPCLVLHGVHRNLSVMLVNRDKTVSVSGKLAAGSLEKLPLAGHLLILCSYIATL